MKPWVCPKCSRVWGPLVSQCVPCNNVVSRANAGVLYPTRDSNVAPARRG